MTMAVFGYLILINIEFYGFISPFSSCFFQVSFDLEDISNTQDSVWRHFQIPRSSSKILRFASYQSTPLSVFGKVVKQGLSGLIGYTYQSVFLRFY